MDTAATLSPEDAKIIEWLDSLTADQRAGVIISHAAAASKWSELTPAHKLKIWKSDTAIGSGNDGDFAMTPTLDPLTAGDYTPQPPDEVIMDAEESAGIDKDHPLVKQLAAEMAGKAIFELADWLLASGDRRTLELQRRLSASLVRLTALGWALQVGDFGGQSLARLAEELTVTRATLSHAAMLIKDRWGLFHRGQKSQGARAVYAARQVEVWAARPVGEAGLKIKNSRQREAIFAALEANPAATTADLAEQIGCPQRSASRVRSLWLAKRTTAPEPVPVVESAPVVATA